MLKKLQWRLVAIFILITVFLIVPISLFLNKGIEDSYYRNFKDSIEEGFRFWTINSDNSAEEMRYYLVNEKYAMILFKIITVYRSYTIIDMKSLDIVYSSDRVFSKSHAVFNNEIHRSSNLLSVMAGKKSQGDRAEPVRIGDRKYFDYARRISLQDGDFILYFRYDSEDWSKILKDFNNILLNGLLLSIAISLLLGFVLAKTITSPIVRIMNKANSLARGNFEQVLEVRSDDEIGKLTEAFNYMARNLKYTLAEISSEKNKLETILNYMTDGVIAFNAKGEVIHANPASYFLTGIKDLNIRFDNLARLMDIDSTLGEVLDNNVDSSEQDIKYKDKYFKVYFGVFTNEMRSKEGIIMVIHDVTEQQKLELMRKEFVANVSHELRTPLTSIKSYSETLLEGALDDRNTAKKFISVINDEADRMARLVKDLLQLSSLDNRQVKWNMENLSLDNLIRSCVDKIRIEAENRGQSINCGIKEGIPSFTGDRDRLEQVILNILINAIKYTPEKGRIDIETGSLKEEVYIKVTDTGVGIPQSDLPRIFERFYRVDKARSRELGGTGLGLSIAREITEAHKGRIEIKSEVDVGTEVTIILPAGDVHTV